MPVHEICQTLDGKLPMNEVETTSLTGHLMARDARGELSFDWPRFFQELCDLQVDVQDNEWDKDSSYCMPCIHVLLRSRLRLWWLAKKRERESSSHGSSSVA